MQTLTRSEREAWCRRVCTGHPPACVPPFNFDTPEETLRRTCREQEDAHLGALQCAEQRHRCDLEPILGTRTCAQFLNLPGNEGHRDAAVEARRRSRICLEEWHKKKAERALRRRERLPREPAPPPRQQEPPKDLATPNPFAPLETETHYYDEGPEEEPPEGEETDALENDRPLRKHLLRWALGQIGLFWKYLKTFVGPWVPWPPLPDDEDLIRNWRQRPSLELQIRDFTQYFNMATEVMTSYPHLASETQNDLYRLMIHLRDALTMSLRQRQERLPMPQTKEEERLWNALASEEERGEGIGLQRLNNEEQRGLARLWDPTGSLLSDREAAGMALLWNEAAQTHRLILCWPTSKPASGPVAFVVEHARVNGLVYERIVEFLSDPDQMNLRIYYSNLTEYQSIETEAKDAIRTLTGAISHTDQCMAVCFFNAARESSEKHPPPAWNGLVIGRSYGYAAKLADGTPDHFGLPVDFFGRRQQWLAHPLPHKEPLEILGEEMAAFEEANPAIWSNIRAVLSLVSQQFPQYGPWSIKVDHVGELMAGTEHIEHYLGSAEVSCPLASQKHLETFAILTIAPFFLISCGRYPDLLIPFAWLIHKPPRVSNIAGFDAYLPLPSQRFFRSFPEKRPLRLGIKNFRNGRLEEARPVSNEAEKKVLEELSDWIATLIRTFRRVNARGEGPLDWQYVYGVVPPNDRGIRPGSASSSRPAPQRRPRR